MPAICLAIAFCNCRFKEDLNDAVEDLNDEQLGELASWRSFYEDHKVGRKAYNFFQIDFFPIAGTQQLMRWNAAGAPARFLSGRHKVGACL